MTPSSAPTRADDVDLFDLATSFVARLHRDFMACSFEAWFVRTAMPSRGLRFHQEIQDAVAARERLVLVVGPKAALSDYVRPRGRETRAERSATGTTVLAPGRQVRP
jgi:hypothetical protein